jgi:hypothetical protein
MMLLRVLHRLSWLVFLSVFLWTFAVRLPPHGSLILSLTLWYILVYWLCLGIRRLCGYGRTPVVRPTASLAPEPVRIRRIVLEDITPYDERTGHAR